MIEDRIRIPANVDTLEAYRAWAHSDEFPDRGHFFFIDDELWIDMSPENLFTHNQVKRAVGFALNLLADETRLGRYFPDGPLVTHERANLSTEPDAVFILHRSFKAGKVRFTNRRGAPLEIQGSPDLVVEVVSETSIKKDRSILFDLYWQAGVAEYWILDARGAIPQFELFVAGPSGFVATPQVNGWQASRVLERSFRLESLSDEMGPDYRLLVQ